MKEVKLDDGIEARGYSISGIDAGGTDTIYYPIYTKTERQEHECRAIF